jgi:nitronate monooxygenase
MLRYVLGTRALEKSTHKTDWKSVWSAGQGVGLIHDVQPTAKIIEDLVRDYWAAKKSL